MPRPKTITPITRISATHAAELANINKVDLDAAIDTGQCLSFDCDSRNRYTCIEWVGEWQRRLAEERASLLTGGRFDRYEKSIQSRQRRRYS